MQTMNLWLLSFHDTEYAVVHCFKMVCCFHCATSLWPTLVSSVKHTITNHCTPKLPVLTNIYNELSSCLFIVLFMNDTFGLSPTLIMTLSPEVWPLYIKAYQSYLFVHCLYCVYSACRL